MQNSIVTLKDVEETYSQMSVAQIKELVLTSLEFKAATKWEVEEVLEVIQQLQNNIVGMSNKVLCASHDRNHWEVIKYLRNKGWLDEESNTLTPKGFVEMNNGAYEGSFDIASDTVVLQSYEGSLYWNRQHENFEKIWKEVLENTDEDREYNKKLKNTVPPISRQTRKMLLSMPNMSVLNNGKTVNK